jgi:tetratricopeptide (TPR) repeat protein
MAADPNDGELAVAASYWDYLLARNEESSAISVLAAQERRIAVRSAHPPYPLRNQFADRMQRAKLLSDLGRNEEAEQIVRVVLREVEANRGLKEIQSYMSYLRADACGMLHRVAAADALSYCEKAVDIAMKEKSLDSIDGYYLRQSLGVLYMLAGKREQALASYEDGLRILRAVEGPNTRSHRASEMMTAVGMGYTVMGKPDQGVQLLSEACSIKLLHFGPKSGNAVICHSYLAKTLFKLNRIDEARAAIERVTPAIKHPELRASTRDELLAVRATLKLPIIAP